MENKGFNSQFVNVTILLPAINETYSLNETVDTIVDTCNINDLKEIIIILCNKTTVDCRKAANRSVHKYEGVLPIYIYEQVKPYVGSAIQEGFDLAKGSHVILMSSDLETPPKLVSKFIEISKVNSEKVITATRWSKEGTFLGYNKIKLVCNFVFQHMISFLFLTKLTDLTYAYRIFPTNLVQGIQWEESKHPFFLETALKPMRLGIKFIEIPAKWEARTEGSSQNDFWANFAYFKTAWHVRWMNKNNIIKKKGA